MNHDLSDEFFRLVICSMITFLVWRYYRHKTYGEWDCYSTFGPRFWAPAADDLVLWPLGFATTALFTPHLSGMTGPAVILVQNMAWLIYTVVLHVRCGQTVGKMITKVQVVDFRTGGKISWLQGWLREGIPTLLFLGVIVYQAVLGRAPASAAAQGVLLAVPGLWFLVEIMTMFSNPKRRALHDYIAGTVVIRTNVKEPIGLPRTLPTARPPRAPSAVTT